jgi:predicted TIM-barrel fold metal-dependent hydrolase
MDRAWLGRRIEEPLDPDLEIVDPHHHLWPAGSRYGRYGLDDLLIDTAAGHHIVQTVFVECRSSYLEDGPHRLRPLGETQYVAAMAETSEDRGGPSIDGIVAHADLTLGRSVAEVLQAHIVAAHGRLRGIRHASARSDELEVSRGRTEPPADLYRHPEFQAGARVLAELGLTFDAWQYHYQLDTVGALARAVPDLVIVVDHLGGPLGVGRFDGRDHEVRQHLRDELEGLAELANVYLKLGGVGMIRFGSRWQLRPQPPASDDVVAVWSDLVRWAIDTFGPGRCMFESNYPVDGETVGYGVLWNAFKKMASPYNPTEKADLFAATARRVYRLPAPYTRTSAMRLTW